MSDPLDSPYMQAAEYGSHLLGVLPDGTVTGVLVHDGSWFKSYMETGDNARYPHFEREFERTPLEKALPAFAEEGPLTDLRLTHVHYRGTIYEPAPMESALSGWRFEYERSRHFRSQVLRGHISLPAPAIFNRYGELYIEDGYGDEAEDIYWDFISSIYEHRMSHYEATA